MSKLILSKNELSELVKKIASEAQIDMVKDQIKSAMTTRTNIERRIKVTEDTLKKERNLLEKLDVRLERLANGDLSVVDDTTVNCPNCKCTTYNKLEVIKCPYCEYEFDV